MSKIELPPPSAWICTRRLSGDKAVFDLPVTTANPAYVKAHPDHDWQPLYRDRQIVEVCAQICRQKAREWGAYVPSANWEFRSHGAEECEAAIRNLIEGANNG